jgi:hypothetical protein
MRDAPAGRDRTSASRQQPPPAKPGPLRWPLHTSLSAMSRYGFAYLLAAFAFALMLRHNVLVDELGWESLRKPVGQSASSTTGGRSIKPWILSFLFCCRPAY